MDGLSCADVGVAEDRPLHVGALTFQPLFTPGHTDTHHSYLVDLPGVTRVFTGDALLIAAGVMVSLGMQRLPWSVLDRRRGQWRSKALIS